MTTTTLPLSIANSDVRAAQKTLGFKELPFKKPADNYLLSEDFRSASNASLAPIKANTIALAVTAIVASTLTPYLLILPVVVFVATSHFLVNRTLRQELEGMNRKEKMDQIYLMRLMQYVNLERTKQKNSWKKWSSHDSKGNFGYTSSFSLLSPSFSARIKLIEDSMEKKPAKIDPLKYFKDVRLAELTGSKSLWRRIMGN